MNFKRVTLNKGLKLSESLKNTSENETNGYKKKIFFLANFEKSITLAQSNYTQIRL
jgi:hypothetical protein